MVIDFVPVLQYTYFFHVAVLCLVLLAFWQCASGNILKQNVVEFNAGWGFILAVLITLYIGLRPVNAVFGDTMNYASGFEELKYSPFVWRWESEWAFQNAMRWFAEIGRASCRERV